MNNETEALKINWDYTTTCLKAYESLLDYVVIANTQNWRFMKNRTRVNIINKEYSTRLYTFYVMVCYKFDEYLKETHDTNIKRSDYVRLSVDNNDITQLNRMFHLISFWSQSAGMFNTVNKSPDPNTAVLQKYTPRK